MAEWTSTSELVHSGSKTRSPSFQRSKASRSRCSRSGEIIRSLACTAVAGAVNLYSDTQIQPSEGMRRTIAAADVGDEQRGADPTTQRLEERVAELLGQEAGLFLPSGTMCNQISLRLHSRPGGDELILDATAHPIIAEAGGPAWSSGLMITALDGEAGISTADQVRAAIRPDSRYMPRSRVVSFEQTTNMGGGRVWPVGGILEGGEGGRAGGADPRGGRGGPRARPAHPSRRRAADERRGRVRHQRRGVRRRL